VGPLASVTIRRTYRTAPSLPPKLRELRVRAEGSSDGSAEISAEADFDDIEGAAAAAKRFSSWIAATRAADPSAAHAFAQLEVTTDGVKARASLRMTPGQLRDLLDWLHHGHAGQ